VVVALDLPKGKSTVGSVFKKRQDKLTGLIEFQKMVPLQLIRTFRYVAFLEKE
jgi:hypothetical protein